MSLHTFFLPSTRPSNPFKDDDRRTQEFVLTDTPSTPWMCHAIPYHEKHGTHPPQLVDGLPLPWPWPRPWPCTFSTHALGGYGDIPKRTNGMVIPVRWHGKAMVLLSYIFHPYYILLDGRVKD
ncbi:hypothetical protein PAAG_02373 [Paracoccidioides lutzii Pb01]|uniref:Uncharacterized protein n=1 Tax=Paracoccidioides lutzii (strain ATCC MYA-826 / Pb01) TaxID=502779 RepID=C1GUQ0_PARBA|nr:hypothetical protein PAAG_02373 [Paracoccidioides lutzii Pb01]EEH40318.2 hypothetical protein PAAG_02373 [Paracoccidioides lutzii Pb01]